MTETARFPLFRLGGNAYEARLHEFSAEANHDCLHVHIAETGGCELFAIMVGRDIPQNPADIIVLDHEERVPRDFKMAPVKWANARGKLWEWNNFLMSAGCMEWEISP